MLCVWLVFRLCVCTLYTVLYCIMTCVWLVCGLKQRVSICTLYYNNNNNNEEDIWSIGAIPMVTMAQSAANWRNMTRVDHTHSFTHLQLHQHSYKYNHFMWSASSAISIIVIHYRIWNHIFLVKVSERGGATRSTWRKPPTACPLISITY